MTFKTALEIARAKRRLPVTYTGQIEEELNLRLAGEALSEMFLEFRPLETRTRQALTVGTKTYTITALASALWLPRVYFNGSILPMNYDIQTTNLSTDSDPPETYSYKLDGNTVILGWEPTSSSDWVEVHSLDGYAAGTKPTVSDTIFSGESETSNLLLGCYLKKLEIKLCEMQIEDEQNQAKVQRLIFALGRLEKDYAMNSMQVHGIVNARNGIGQQIMNPFARTIRSDY